MIAIKTYTNNDLSAVGDSILKTHITKFSNHPHWLPILNKSFGNSYFMIVAQDNDKIVGHFQLVLLKSRIFGKYLISMPYLNYGGPVSPLPEIKRLLIDEAIKIAKKIKVNFLEIREDQRQDWNLNVRTSKITLLLDLPESPDILWENYKSKLRNQIQRPAKEGMVFKIGGKELINDFYYCFAINMRDLGTPVYAKKFFENIISGFPENTKVGVVYTSTMKPAAAGIIFHFGELVEIPWASSIRRFNKYSPNMLLYWEFLRFAIKNGYSKFDFGRCTPGSGTHKFKLQWGGDEKQLFWYYWLPSDKSELPELNPNNPRYKIIINTWRRLPVCMTKIIGPGIVKKLP